MCAGGLPVVDTDTRNVLEMSRATYTRRIRDGTPRDASRMEAIAYLRRKTSWAAAFAAGAFDAYLATENSTNAIVDNREDDTGRIS